MKKKISFVLLGFVIVLTASGVWLYDWVLGETEAASGPISSAPVAVENASLDPSGTDLASPPGLRTFEIVQESSEVRFTIYEELRGQPVNVVGVTDQVAGQLAMDLNDPSTLRMGEIRINARTFVTDEGMRDRATRNRILHTDEYEYITFKPSEIIGIEGNAAIGERLQFTVAGDLTIRDVVRPAVFEARMQIASPDSILGEATTAVSRSDFNLVVPNLAFLANVADEVMLEFEGELRALGN